MYLIFQWYLGDNKDRFELHQRYVHVSSLLSVTLEYQREIQLAPLNDHQTVDPSNIHFKYECLKGRTQYIVDHIQVST